MNDHKSKLHVPSIGTWVLNVTTGNAEFIGEKIHVPDVGGSLRKFFEGGSRSTFIDPQYRFVLLDAQDEVLRGDASSGEIKAVANLKRQEDHGLRRSTFISAPVPVFIFEHGVAVFDSDGQLHWSRNDLKLDHHFERIEGDRIIYSSEHRGKWAYDLSTGRPAG
jgi:hypothetical protein